MIPPFPRATMRLQLSSSMTFQDASDLVPYMASIGISHLYTSPILAAREGSTHGYDIVDHNRLNPELGTEEDLYHLADELHRHDMGLVVDFVPNHMGVGYSDNVWWLNVLEWGRYSPYASFFDIDWKPSEQSLRGKVLVPVLGDQYGTVLENGELRLIFDASRGTFSVHYYEHRLPVSPRHYQRILKELTSNGAFPPSGEPVAPQQQDQIAALATAFGALGPGNKSASRQAILVRKAAELQGTLARLAAEHPEVSESMKALCDHWNGTVGDDRSFDRLHSLLEAQAYRLAYWRLASNEINYRRFFDINDLAAVRIELPEVFEITHQLILRYIQDGVIQGLRLDHIDGLLDPKAYLQRLQEAAAYRLLGKTFPVDSRSSAAIDQPVYVVVEKILAGHENIRSEWPVSGTTGYEHMAEVAEVLFSPDGEDGITRAYELFVGTTRDFEAEVIRAKYRTMQETLASELNVLANRLSRLAKSSRKTRDFSRLALRRALTDIVAHFPVYRSYVDYNGPTDDDRRYIEWAAGRARKAAKTFDPSGYDFIQAVLTTDILQTYRGEFRRREVVKLAMKVQQFTAPVMAKSFEDTAFYRDARFIGRNEVGSEPDTLYTSPQGFHYSSIQRLENHPFAMVSTATHDHKRGEDVRSRLNVLSEIPESWIDWTERFAEYTTGLTTEVDGTAAPDRNDQFFLLQTIIGTWPLDLSGPDYNGIETFRDRIREYAGKAIREAKVHTSWTAVYEDYERAVEKYVDALLNPKRSPTIIRLINKIVDTIAEAGAVNSLSQKLLTLTVPGVPDLYQGTERWDFSLVDPDNRRPVDFSTRRAAASAASTASVRTRTPDLQKLTANWRDGAIKQHLISRVLNFRKDHPDLFALGSYIPLEVTGSRDDHVIAFMRVHEGKKLVVVVPRFVQEGLGQHPDAQRALSDAKRTLAVPPEYWGDTAVVLPASSATTVPTGTTGPTTWRGVLDDADIRPGRHDTDDNQTLPVEAVLNHLPVAALFQQRLSSTSG